MKEEPAKNIFSKKSLLARLCAWTSNAQAMEIQAGMQHPAILHLYCHLMELSNDPLAAVPAADVLRDMFSASGHLLHMASHIDIWAGHYKVTGQTHGCCAMSRHTTSRAAR